MSPSSVPKRTLDRERLRILRLFENWLELPMLILGILWLVLLGFELRSGLDPMLEALRTIIWAIFGLEFAFRFVLAPRKWAFLGRSWLSVLALVLPPLRVLRIGRAIRLLHLIPGQGASEQERVVSAVNRGLRAFDATMKRRGFEYVMLITVFVMFAGAAGAYAFEKDPTGTHGFDSYGSALWWTTMTIMTMGSGAWPHTVEGRILGLLLALYSFTAFAYITASLASHFLERDAESEHTQVASAKSIENLQHEIAALRREIQGLSGKIDSSDLPMLAEGFKVER